MKKAKTAIVFGSSGQDGSLMCKLLSNKNYKVYALSQRKINTNFKRLKIKKKNIIKKKINYYNYEKIKKIISKSHCQEIYFFGGQSSPSFSFKNYLNALESHILPVFNILHSIYEVNKKIKFFNTSSGEVFKANQKRLNENSLKEPSNPYGLAKLHTLLLVKFYRQNYKLKCFSGILFNHESELRPKNYVIAKIINFIKIGNFSKKLEMGNINAVKDWGWAPEYINIIYWIMKKKYIDDFIIATGKSSKLKEVINMIFKTKNLDWKKYVFSNEKLFRSFDTNVLFVNNNKLKNKLNIQPKIFLPEIISKLTSS